MTFAFTSRVRGRAISIRPDRTTKNHGPDQYNRVTNEPYPVCSGRRLSVVRFFSLRTVQSGHGQLGHRAELPVHQPSARGAGSSQRSGRNRKRPWASAPTGLD